MCAIKRSGTPPRVAPVASTDRTGVGVAVMAAASCLTVANLYLNQPLLGAIGRAFSVGEHRAALVSSCGQIGYAAGILLLVPLGDVLSVRRLVRALLVVAAAALGLAAASPSLAWLCGATLLLALHSVVPQLLIPTAAAIAPPAGRARVVSRVQVGLALGMLLGRAAAGLLGAQLGWRAAYATFAVATAVLVPVLPPLLPAARGRVRLGLGALLASLPRLLAREPHLRRSCVLGALVFGAFNVFWTSLAFFLEQPPHRMGPAGVGLYAALAAPGALAGPWVGPWIDRRGRHGPRAGSRLATTALILAFAILAVAARSPIGLALGAMVLNFASTANQLTNQARIFALGEEVRSRLNTVFMVCTFGGGALGAVGGSWAWTRAGFPGVCALGLGLAVLAAVYVLVVEERPQETRTADQAPRR